jgi:hypothetical protein
VARVVPTNFLNHAVSNPRGAWLIKPLGKSQAIKAETRLRTRSRAGGANGFVEMHTPYAELNSDDCLGGSARSPEPNSHDRVEAY